MPDIMYLFETAAPCERVYAALTSTDGIRAWWTRDAEIAHGVGGIGTFAFRDGTLLTTVCIKRLEPPRLVAWTTIDSNVAGWDGTTLAFELQPGDAGTTIRFSHRGFADPDDAYARTTWGWGLYFRSLDCYLTTGKGTPHGDC